MTNDQYQRDTAMTIRNVLGVRCAAAYLRNWGWSIEATRNYLLNA